ncbi:MAG: hypothetical protein AUH78_20970 [Gemmatimonadetes bacterium 13_1_40CM_4_69_8]|nr:MAG: hypothetical protein AUH78_20970 [Gemmatimonadetes bacterium 13_1_40CM_4_69_8]
MLEEHGEGQVGLRSGIEHDDVRTALVDHAVQRLESVGHRDQEQARVLGHHVLELSSRAGPRRHDEHSYHGATSA